ncbi:MAG: ABC-F family ATP-binding cassette domain-containing protein [Chlamydiales bacterium]|nr:ABC-F family ATP-binding cassette domain-containing protein [Chlamydiales bacterium]
MTSLISIHSLSKSFGTEVLFEEISFVVSQGDHLGLIGPNGAGKSTLLKILMGLEKADSGSIAKRQGLRVGYASQVPEFPSKSLEQVLVDHVLNEDPEELLTRARILLGKAQFTDFSQDATLLSGGWKKRLDIVRALMIEPDLLLLDEPTNHLDLEGILWLEKFLAKEKITYIVISHDRYFLENVVNKVLELNKCYPQGLFMTGGKMSTFATHRDAFLEAQLQQERGLASVVRDEIDWLKRSPKARTTKSESRVQRAHELINELAAVRKRNKTHKVNIEFSASERETRKLIVAKNIGKSIDGKTLFKGIDLNLSPGSRIGIVGKNGTGKTTLLKILAGVVPQDMGTVKYAEDLRLVYFDQHREHIPPEISLKEALAPNGDMVNYRGQSIHVNGWAKKFLFQADRLTIPVKCLSGGERARILIAKLMLEPADVLFLDEPTNDLDIETLEVIEESLKEFAGAVVLITHDRALMDNICTQILGLGSNLEQQLFADLRQFEQSLAATSFSQKKEELFKPSSAVSDKPSKKLSYKEQKELEGMEQAIMGAELELETLQQKLDDPVVHADPQKVQEGYVALGFAQTKLDKLFERWQYLLDKSRGT